MKGESRYKISKLMGNFPEICRQHYAALIPDVLCDSVEFPQPHLEKTSDPQAKTIAFNQRQATRI